MAILGEVIERAAGEFRADEHSQAVGDERQETLRGAAQVRGRLLIGIKLAGHEEEIEAETVEQDSQIEHPYGGAGVAVRQQAVTQAPAEQAEHENAAHRDAPE